MIEETYKFYKKAKDTLHQATLEDNFLKEGYISVLADFKVATTILEEKCPEYLSRYREEKLDQNLPQEDKFDLPSETVV